MLFRSAQASSVVNSRRLETGRRLQTSLLWSASWDVFVYEQQMSAAAGRSVPILEGGNIKDGVFSCFFPPGSAGLLAPLCMAEATAIVQDLRNNAASVESFAAALLVECLDKSFL